MSPISWPCSSTRATVGTLSCSVSDSAKPLLIIDIGPGAATVTPLPLDMRSVQREGLQDGGDTSYVRQ